MTFQFLSRRSLATRVALLTMAMVLVGMAAFTLFISQTLRPAMQEQISAQQFDTVSIVAGQVNQAIEQRLGALKSMAQRISPAMLAEPKRTQAFLEDRATLFELFNAGAYVTRMDGTAMASVPLTIPRTGTNFLERNHVAAALKEGQSIVSQVVIGKALKAPVFAMATPIHNAQGKVIGALVGVIDLGKPNFLDKLTQIRLGQTGYYTLQDPKDHLIITGTDKDRIMQRLVPGANPLADRFRQGFEGSGVVINSSGVEVLSCAKGIPAAGWILVGTLPTAEAFAAINAMRQTLRLAGLFFMLLVGGLVWWRISHLLQQQISPVLKASNAVKLLADSPELPKQLQGSGQDEIGELIGGFNQLLEVAAQREVALKNSEDRYRTLVEWSPEAVLVHRQGTVLYVNPAAATLFGAKNAAEMVGQQTSHLIHPDFVAAQKARMQSIVNQEPIAPKTESRFLRLDGTAFDVEVQGTAIDFAGAPAIHVAIRDITERKQFEAALIAAKATAEDASRAKSNFLANMSHEIRTPMNGVIGMVDIMQQTELKPAQQRMLDTIHDSSLALLNILNDILDFSKIEAGKLALESVPVQLGALAQGVAQLMSNAASAKAIALSVQVSPELPPWVLGDPSRLRQVLVNLLGNAIKFTASLPDRPGQVTLQMEPCAVSDAGPGMRLRIIDNGIGMDAAVVAKLFQPFTQADASTSRKFGGTGLGLSITQRLVELMQGRITVHSTPGVGSEFAVELRLRPCEAGPTPADAALRRPPVPHMHQGSPQAARTALSVEQALARGQLILLAEDNAINREVIQEQLRLLGYTCEVAEDGAVALAMWQSGLATGKPRYALLLTDCHMPHLDGFGLTDAIRRAEPTGTRLPIIAITANAMQGEAQRCRDRGMDDYLTKPLRMRELSPLLAKWLPLDAPIWDPASLSALVGDNPAMHKRLLDKFLLTAQQQVTDILAACVADDAPTVAAVAHPLKSAARTVGALALGELCQALEAAGRAGDTAQCRQLATGLTEALHAAESKINGHLAL
jgi:two-component system sensor histidine kinase/response regulator